jgi:hypothetical protein
MPWGRGVGVHVHGLAIGGLVIAADFVRVIVALGAGRFGVGSELSSRSKVQAIFLERGVNAYAI